jgi:hypothetical protein
MMVVARKEHGAMSRQPIKHRTWSPSVLVLGGALLLAECACAESPTSPNPAGNLVPNGSFERNGQATLDTWEVSNPALASLVPDAAPGGGAWSLRLQADQVPTTSQARVPVQGLADGDVVRLTAYVRASGVGGGGLAGIEVTGADGHVRQKSYAAGDEPQWTQVELTFTIAMQSGDTIWVVLKAPPTELTARAGLFDLVTLERTGPSR